MGGRLTGIYDVAKQRAELDRLMAIDSASYKLAGSQSRPYQLNAMQALGRSLRSGWKKTELRVLKARSGAGKSMMFNHDFAIGDTMDTKNDENNDISNVDFDYIGELIVDTRNYDVDEDNMGLIVMDSNVISLSGSASAELTHKDMLSSTYVPGLIGIDKLDECEVEIGIFRYVFGFSVRPFDTVEIFLDEAVDIAEDNQPKLISKHKYPFGEEEFLDKEYAEDGT